VILFQAKLAVIDSHLEPQEGKHNNEKTELLGFTLKDSLIERSKQNWSLYQNNGTTGNITILGLQ
jgi:hypothetical protein